MHRIQYLTDARTIEIGSATTLLRASLDHGIAHTHVCGGNAKCSTCRVLEVRLKGKSGTYPLYEVTALAGSGA